MLFFSFLYKTQSIAQKQQYFVPPHDGMMATSKSYGRFYVSYVRFRCHIFYAGIRCHNQNVKLSDLKSPMSDVKYQMLEVIY